MGNSCCGGAPTRQERVGPRAPPTLRPRARYDQDLREHLLGKSVPHKVELALTTATKFIARARLAHKVVVQRRTAGCSSEHAWNGRKTLTLAQEAELRQHMTREEKVADGLRLLVQRAEHVQVKIVHMEDDGNCQFRSLATELYGDQCYHAHVRAQIVEYMATHSENYRWMVEDLDDDGSRWQLYLRKMGTPRTWVRHRPSQLHFNFTSLYPISGCRISTSNVALIAGADANRETR
eukprot:SAG31_NODE_1264_length_9071_cov_17.828132_2_plen_236_part_00